MRASSARRLSTLAVPGREITEHQLQVAVLKHLAVYGRHDRANWFSIPNAGKRRGRYASKMKREGLQPGAADLCIQLEAGRAAWLELKTLTGRQSQDQKAFELKCLTLGHPYCVARTIDQAIAFLGELGVLRVGQIDGRDSFQLK